MNSNKLNLRKLSEMTVKHLNELTDSEQIVALALVFNEVYQKGKDDLQEAILVSLPDHLTSTEH